MLFAMSDSVEYFLAFSRAGGIGPARIRKLIAHFGSLAAAWGAGLPELSRAGMDERAR